MIVSITIIMASLSVAFVIMFSFFKIKEKNRYMEMMSEVSKVFDSTKTEVVNLKHDINQKISEINTQVIDILQKNNHNVASRFEASNKIFGELKSSISKIDESNKNILDMGSNIVELQNILKAPKPRGSLGEILLEDILGQMFPKSSYKMQYAYKQQDRIVDAIIKLQEGFIPIDAKFPLEYFNKMISASSEPVEKENRKLFVKMVKKHISDISEKYIQPSEGTLDFAMMYIPAENVYYEAVIRDEALSEPNSILQYAINKKVIPVSPNTFFAYLQTLLFGLKGLKIEQEAKTIMMNISKVEKDLAKFEEKFRLLGKNIDRTKSIYDETDERWLFLNKKLSNIYKLDKSAQNKLENDSEELAALPEINKIETSTLKIFDTETN